MTALENLLSPAAIQRDWKDHALDPREPIGPGLRSVGQIVGGHIEYGESSPPVARIRGLTISITKGAIARDPEGHLEGYFLTRSPFGQIQRTLEKLGLGEVTAQSSDTVLSTEASQPSTFQSTQRYAFPAGEILYDFATDQDVELPRDIVVDVSIWATGHLEGRALRGTFRTQLQVMGLPVPRQALEGKFEVLLS